MKLNKKPIEKNNENFPPLEPNNQIQNNEDIAPPKPITTSPNVSEEDVIKSFDDINSLKYHYQSLRTKILKLNYQIPQKKLKAKKESILPLPKPTQLQLP